MTTPPFAYYGLAGYGPTSFASVAEFNRGVYYQASRTTLADVSGYSGVYKGSLSAQGNLVAMQLNPGEYKLEVTKTGRQVAELDADGNPTGRYVDETAPVPWCTGFFRSYYKNPTKCTFGSDSPMPALTLVMPSSMTDMQGNFLYYLDAQMTRITGSNYFDVFHFINVFGQAEVWVSNSNNYIAALKRAEQTNLPYYRSKTYQDFITQGLVTYTQGQALINAFKNLGYMLLSVPDGNFGTPNAVAKTLLDLNLGAVGNLYALLTANRINLGNINDPELAPIISQILASINSPGDLQIIQLVASSSIPNMSSALDYCSISAVSGMANDSIFADFAEVGRDLYQKAPNFALVLGSEFASLLTDLQTNTGPSVEALATTNSLLTPEIIDNLRRILPISINYEPISMVNIIGAASGYLSVYLDPVNSAMKELYATSYGPQIRDALTDISRYAGRVSVSTDETDSFDSYWDANYQAAVKTYYNILNQLVNDQTGEIPRIVKQINENYQTACDLLRLEYLNYNKANINVDGYSDNNQILSFVTNIPNYGSDPLNIGSDFVLYGMASQNAAGDLVRSLLGQTKNYASFANAGVTITGII